MSLLTSLFTLTPPQLPTGYCPQSYQDLVNTIINGTQVTFLIDTGNFIFNFGSATPAPENRIFPWLVFDPSSPYNGMWFTFQFGMWVAPVPVRDLVPGFRQMYLPPAGTLESAVWSLDSGDGTDPTVTPPNAQGTTGAMWQVDHSMDGRFPLGAGTIPDSDLGSGSAQVSINQTTDSLGNSGEYAHKLTGAEGAVEDHIHPIGFGNTGTGDLGLNYETPAVTTPSYTTFFNSSAGPSGASTTSANLLTLKANDGNGVVSVKHNTMPGYRSVWWLMHTSRKFITLPA